MELILLVDDDDAVRAVAHRILVRAGYGVVAAADGVEALALLEREGRPLSLVITDTVMPRLSGPALVAQLALRCPGVPVLLMSGLTDGDLARGESLPAGVTFLQKPFNVDVLLAATREALARVRVA